MKMSMMSIKESFSKISWMILSFHYFAELFSYLYSFVNVAHVCDSSLTQTSLKDRNIYNLNLICKFWLKSFDHLFSFESQKFARIWFILECFWEKIMFLQQCNYSVKKTFNNVFLQWVCWLYILLTSRSEIDVIIKVELWDLKNHIV